MANKRDLKRTINYITSELFAETVAASLYNGKPSQEDVDGILSSVVMINNDFIKRVSHPEAWHEANASTIKNLIMTSTSRLVRLSIRHRC